MNLKKSNVAEKNQSQILLLNQWLKLRQKGRSIQEYLLKRNYREIAVYGMGYLGERVLTELKDSPIKVLYALDRNADSIMCDVDILHLQDELPKVDAVIVSEPFYFSEIEAKLKQRVACPIVSLEEVVYES